MVGDPVDVHAEVQVEATRGDAQDFQAVQIAQELRDVLDGPVAAEVEHSERLACWDKDMYGGTKTHSNETRHEYTSKL